MIENKEFVVLGDLIADYYYDNNLLLFTSGGSSRFNVIANLSQMDCACKVVGGCGNDNTGNILLDELKRFGINTENININNGLTRGYNLMINENVDGSVYYECSKFSPVDGSYSWYNNYAEDLDLMKDKISKDDVLIFDGLDDFQLSCINELKNDMFIDVGSSKDLINLPEQKIRTLCGKFKIIQVNERVMPFLNNFFELKNPEEVFKFLNPKLLIITHGKSGAEFVFNNGKKNKQIQNYTQEIDPTGAGDAFFSVFINGFYKNDQIVDTTFIDRTFEKAIKLTSKVVQNMGARGHIYMELENKFLKSDEDFVKLKS